MSTVRMSDYLVEEILNEFKNSFDKANPPLEDDPKYGDLVYNAHVAPSVKAIMEVANRELADTCDASAMFMKRSQLQLTAPITQFSTTLEDTIESQLEEDMPIVASLSTEQLIPVAIRTYGVHHQYNETEPARFKISRNEDANVEYICACIEYNSELTAKKGIATNKVKTLLGNFTTLNQALKAWPALSKLVSSEKLAKVHTKQERKRKQELHKEIADDLVASADLNKTILAGALIGDDD